MVEYASKGRFFASFGQTMYPLYIPNACRRCKTGTLMNTDADDNGDLYSEWNCWPLESCGDGYICQSCHAHHYLCTNCSPYDNDVETKAEDLVFCQFLGHHGVTPYHRIVRPNKAAYDIFMEFLDAKIAGKTDEAKVLANDHWNLHLNGINLTTEDYKQCKDEVVRIGWVEGSHDEPIPYCLEDMDVDYVMDKIEDHPKQSRFFLTHRSNYAKPEDQFCLTGPDGGYSTYWRCRKCLDVFCPTDK